MDQERKHHAGIRVECAQSSSDCLITIVLGSESVSRPESKSMNGARLAGGWYELGRGRTRMTRAGRLALLKRDAPVADRRTV